MKMKDLERLVKGHMTEGEAICLAAELISALSLDEDFSDKIILLLDRIDDCVRGAFISEVVNKRRNDMQNYKYVVRKLKRLTGLNWSKCKNVESAILNKLNSGKTIDAVFEEMKKELVQ